MADVTAIIDGSQLSDGAKRRALPFFRTRCAEAKAHGKTPDTVLFHEVGAVDSIVDVCSVAICLDDLGMRILSSSRSPRATAPSTVPTALCPFPSPLSSTCARRAISPSACTGRWRARDAHGRRHRHRSAHIRQLPSRYRIEAVGYGAGKRPYEGCSGTLRCLLVDADA
ncbi:MAG: nickel insertion protein [Collinsella sp.]